MIESGEGLHNKVVDNFISFPSIKRTSPFDIWNLRYGCFFALLVAPVLLHHDKNHLNFGLLKFTTN
jgi:hypothetical protein